MKTLSSYAYGISLFQKHLCMSRESKIIVANSVLEASEVAKSRKEVAKLKEKWK